MERHYSVFSKIHVITIPQFLFNWILKKLVWNIKLTQLIYIEECFAYLLNVCLIVLHLTCLLLYLLPIIFHLNSYILLEFGCSQLICTNKLIPQYLKYNYVKLKEYSGKLIKNLKLKYIIEWGVPPPALCFNTLPTWIKYLK